MVYPRNAARFLHTRRSTMTFMAAARTSAQSAAFDTLHRPLDQHAMDHAACDDDNRKQHMGDAPRSRPQSQSPAECRQNRDGEDCPHGDHTKGENGVGDVKVRASIMSGGLVIQRPPTWITTATTSVPPIH